MYDWANSAYATSGIAAIFPVYFILSFRNSFGDNVLFMGTNLTGSSVWSFGIISSTLIVAIASPVLGVLTDRRRMKKVLLLFFTFAGSLFTTLAFFSSYVSHAWAWLLICFIVGNIGFAGALVFYNSLLPHISPRQFLDNVSSRGFAYGYLGGGVLLLVHLLIIMQASDSAKEDLVTRLCIASIGIWWFGWSIWTVKVVPEPDISMDQRGLALPKLIKISFVELINSINNIAKFPVVILYLLAYLLFNDGIQTVMGIAGAFAAETLGVPLVFNMATILIIQFVAAPGTMVFNWASNLTSTKRALIISLIGWSVIVLFGISTAPLVPSKYTQFDYGLTYNNHYQKYELTQAPTLNNNQIDNDWKTSISPLMGDKYLTTSESHKLLNEVDKSALSRFSIVFRGGPLDSFTSINVNHTAILDNNIINKWPSFVRTNIWSPLNLEAGYQWLILGVLVGTVMGGSQALARSLFAQITPLTRSGEFFSFFGFMSRASSVIGPTMYILFTSMFDQRIAVSSLLLIIIAGTILLKWVDVSKGSEAAKSEDSLIVIKQ